MAVESPACCRLCDSDNKQLILRAPQVYGGEGTHSFWECKNCGIIFLYPFLSKEQEANFYRQEFEKFMDARSGPERDWTRAEAHIASNQDNVTRRMKVLAPYLSAGKDVLELGCSSGFMLDAMQTVGANCVGIEPSAVFSDFLRNKGHRVYASLDELENSDVKIANSFDLIVHFFVLEHIADPAEFIRRQLGLLRPGGKIVMEVPSATDALTSLYKIPAFEKFYWSIAHHYYYKPNSLRFLLDQLNVSYELKPSQRYDLSNHMTWMNDGRPGGQGRYSEVFSQELIETYRRDLVDKGFADTYFVILNQVI